MKKIADRVFSIVFKRMEKSDWEPGLCFEGYNNWIVDSQGKNPESIYDYKPYPLLNMPVSSIFKSIDTHCVVLNNNPV